MKSVSTVYVENQSRPRNVAVQYVKFKRRYWVEADKAYTWEGDWTTLPTDEVVTIGQIIAKLDTEQLNEFKISNLNITLKNDLNQWLPDNAAGYLKALGAGAAAQAYFPFEPYWTKFQIVLGYADRDGSEVTATIFTGLATKFTFDAQSDVVQVSVQGLEALLINADAENVAQVSFIENLGTGDGSTVDFTTAQNGVGLIDVVYLDADTERPGVDYSVSQLNEPSLPAKITFTVAPAVAQVVYCNYRYWYANKRIEELIQLLLDEIGTTGEIEPALFPNGVSQLFTQDTLSDWLAGTFSKTDANRVAGSVVLTYSDTGNKELLDNFDRGSSSTIGNGWTNWSGASMSLVSNKLSTQLTTDTLGTLIRGFITRPSDRISGVWQFGLEFSGTGPVAVSYGFLVNGFTYNNVSGVMVFRLNGYAVEVGGSSSGGTGSIQLVNDALSTTTRVLGFATFTIGASHTIRIDRTPNGLMNVYIDGAIKISVLDTAWMAGGYITIGSVNNASAIALINDAYWPSETVSGTFVTQTLDALTTPLEWGRVLGFTTPMAGSISYETRSSTDGISWDAYLALGANNRIESALKRYLQIKATLTTPTTGNSDPSLDKITASYINTATLLTLANFTGKTVYQAIQELAKFANYEWGFTETEAFFFRSKTVDRTVDMALTQWDQISELSAMEMGYDRVYTEVVATYGAFTSKVKDDGQARLQPAARFISRRFTVDGGSILLPADTQIAQGIADLFFSEFSRPRKRFKTKTKFLPWIDLSDTIEVTFLDNLPARPWTFGDPDFYLGQKDIYFYGGADQLASKMLAKVIGYRHDPDRMSSEFDMEEILI